MRISNSTFLKNPVLFSTGFFASFDKTILPGSWIGKMRD